MTKILFLGLLTTLFASCVKEHTCKCELLGESGIDATDGSVIYSVPYGEKTEIIKGTKNDAEDACEALNGKTYLYNEEGDIIYAALKNCDLN